MCEVRQMKNIHRKKKIDGVRSRGEGTTICSSQSSNS